jgi:hypothetical protein
LHYCSGEHIRNWRGRYFILKDDGQFLGFRSRPTMDMDLTDPLNNFTVRNCEILESNKPKPFTFAIRGLQMTTVVVRTFHVESEEERWVAGNCASESVDHVWNYYGPQKCCFSRLTSLA